MSSTSHPPLLIELEQLRPCLADPAILASICLIRFAMPPGTCLARSSSTTRIYSGVRGIAIDKEVIVYYQTCHRSTHTFWVLRYFGYLWVRSYPGARSTWRQRS